MASLPTKVFEPSWDCVPNQAGAGIGIDYLINTMGENTEWPAVGDLVIELVSDSMGMGVKDDLRWRVTATQTPYKTSFIGISQNGKREILHIFYLRKHKTIPRVWFLLN